MLFRSQPPFGYRLLLPRDVPQRIEGHTGGFGPVLDRSDLGEPRQRIAGDCRADDRIFEYQRSADHREAVCFVDGDRRPQAGLLQAAKLDIDLATHLVRIESATPERAFAEALTEEGYAPAEG